MQIASRVSAWDRVHSMDGFRAFVCGAGIAALAASASGQSEIFPNVHNQPIVIHIVDGRDGKPLAHTRLSLVGGYTKRDLHLQMWHEEALTDDQGRARMSSAMENLPILQIEVAKSHLCADSRSATVSVEQIRRDGVSMPNRCGTVTAEDTPGVFSVFVKARITKSNPALNSRQAASLNAARSN